MMIKNSLLIMILAFLLFACQKTGESTSEEQTSEKGMTLTEFLDSFDQLTSVPPKDLEVLVPLSNDQLKKLIPEKVGNMEMKKIMLGHKQALGISSVISTYQEDGEEDRHISMELLDGAGATGNVLVKATEQKLMPDYEEKTEDGYSRIYNYHGIRVWEKLNSKNHSTEIEFVCAGRYQFTFKGYHVPMNELWAFVNDVRKQKK
ncbi:hypothetical protein [Algoriphagus taiwanensis]|uniref:Lipoprotein n=1 Tax=Algoriphagus taiwanensis TaxID=1445656 RepID=A0ABQ6Q656_9BACT|nr:hypothetical protein Ataiwa_32460 [Algoriphagus taiwanensis]